MRNVSIILCMVISMNSVALTKEYHVSALRGDDKAPGTAAKPLRTISAAAALAQPGDTVTVYAGAYREEIDPPRGGESDEKRIVYQAARGEEVIIKGSERIKEWVAVQDGIWKTTIPNTFFGEFNPYSDLIAGDWFAPQGRKHHTGAVYLNGHWLREAVSLQAVLDGPGAKGYLVNLAWAQVGAAGGKYPAAEFTDQHGVDVDDCTEGGKCVGWIQNRDWIRLAGIDFGDGAESVTFRAASATSGGRIEIRLDDPNGKLLGTCEVGATGGWQAWQSFTAEIAPTAGVRDLCLVFRDHESDGDNCWWFAEVDEDNTIIWAQFPKIDPNEAEVEINVRQTVFYPRKTGIDYLTVRGFKMMHAATPWAPPTAEQIGLLGTHWSKGWIIEENEISYSTCTGITLGKHGDEFDNTSADSAEGYVKTIERALEHGWSRENIGHHIVRNNRIHHCEQAGLVGSMGGAFSTITRNEIHDIHIRRFFAGAEMAGIKLHAPIDTVISHNHIYRVHSFAGGLWLDWMTQGTRVTGNLLHDNTRDLFLEVNHGPYLVDNNIFLSAGEVWDWSEGGAFVHNLFAGNLTRRTETRMTPYHKPHSTELAGLKNIQGGDNRFYNNIFAGNVNLGIYDNAQQAVYAGGNVHLQSSKPLSKEEHPLVDSDFNPGISLIEKDGEFHLEINLATEWRTQSERALVTTELLGETEVAQQGYTKPDGSPYRIDRDYFGRKRNKKAPFPGPFAMPKKDGSQTLKVWP